MSIQVQSYGVTLSTGETTTIRIPDFSDVEIPSGFIYDTSYTRIEGNYQEAFTTYATMFAWSDYGKAKAEEYGIKSVITKDEIDGAVLSNGKKFSITDHTTYADLNFLASDGSPLFIFYYFFETDQAQPSGSAYISKSFPNMQDAAIEGNINGYYYAFNNYADKPAAVRFTLSYGPTPGTTFENFESFFTGAEANDPFSPGGGSGSGGGTGDFDGNSDTIPFPNDPPISATDTGFMTVFATNLAGVQSLAASLWSDIFDAIKPGGSLEGTVEALKNIVASPYDAILGCSLLPFPVATSGSKNVKLYGVLPSSVSLPVAASQWKTIDCGTLNVHEFWGAYLDYAPYTKVTSMYLPYIGVVSIDVDMIMAKTIGVKYKCDIITGQCIAIITINGSCEFSYQGQCSVPIPITSIDWSSTVNAGLGLIGSVTGIVGSAVGGALGGGGAFGALAGGVKGAMGEAGAIAQNVMNSKPDIKSGGGVGGSAGQMGIQTPFLIIERPKQSLPSTKGSDGKTYAQNHWTGYPSNIAARLGSLKGYTEVSRVFINRTTATAEEKREIEELLYGGVYL